MENQSIEREADSRISSTGSIRTRLTAERIMEASVVGMMEVVGGVQTWEHSAHEMHSEERSR